MGSGLHKPVENDFEKNLLLQRQILHCEKLYSLPSRNILIRGSVYISAIYLEGFSAGRIRANEEVLQEPMTIDVVLLND